MKHTLTISNLDHTTFPIPVQPAYNAPVNLGRASRLTELLLLGSGPDVKTLGGDVFANTFIPREYFGLDRAGSDYFDPEKYASKFSASKLSTTVFGAYKISIGDFSASHWPDCRDSAYGRDDAVCRDPLRPVSEWKPHRAMTAEMETVDGPMPEARLPALRAKPFPAPLPQKLVIVAKSVLVAKEKPGKPPTGKNNLGMKTAREVPAIAQAISQSACVNPTWRAFWSQVRTLAAKLDHLEYERAEHQHAEQERVEQERVEQERVEQERRRKGTAEK